MQHTLMAAKQRITVNLEASERRRLQDLARHRKVSEAWLARRASLSLLEQTKKHGLPFPFGANPRPNA